MSSQLQTLVAESSVAWLIESYGEERLLERLEAVRSEVERRIAGVSDPGVREPTLQAISELEQYQRVAFFQLVASSCSTEILAASWCILHDANVEALSVDYSRMSDFTLRLTLTFEEIGWKEDFASDDIFDAAFLRHLGIMKVSGDPVFDGVYAIRRG